MDKYEFQIKTEQLGKLLKKGDYKTAAKIADSIDWRKVRNVGLLLKVAEAYEKTERYEDCYEILNIAYDCAPIGRMIVYKMVEIAVMLKDFDEAVELYKEFVRIAPHDLGRYVLKYEIYKGRGSSLEDQIAILEEYKSREYQEEWAYELAELYYKAGMHSKCVEECDDLILWFSEGEFVMKAMELKMRIQPLTASQEQKYRQMVKGPASEEIKVRPVNLDRFNTTNLQAAVAEGLQDLMRQETEAGEQEPEESIQRPEEPAQEPAQSVEEPAPELKEAVEKTEEPAQEPEESVEEPEEEPEEPAEASAETAAGLSPESAENTEPSEDRKPSGVSWSGASPDTTQLPKFIGQDESGQLTFDMEENVLDRQITGQLSIEDILSDWEVKKRQTEAAIAEAAKRDEERRRERERLRATGQLPDLKVEVKTTVPEEIQRLIEEIEGRYPVRVELEPVGKKERGRGKGDGRYGKGTAGDPGYSGGSRGRAAGDPGDSGRAFPPGGRAESPGRAGETAGDRSQEGREDRGGGLSHAGEPGEISGGDDFHAAARPAFRGAEKAVCLLYLCARHEPAAGGASGGGPDAERPPERFPGGKYCNYRRAGQRKIHPGCRYCKGSAEAAPRQRARRWRKSRQKASTARTYQRLWRSSAAERF